MFSEIETKCILDLLEKQKRYMGYFKEQPEYKQLEKLYDLYYCAYYDWATKILQATPAPTKPLNAYVAGGMANGVAGLGAGLAAYQNAKAKEIQYEKLVSQHNLSKMGINSASDKVVYYYGCIVNIINTNPEAAKTLNEAETLIKEEIEMKIKINKETKYQLAAMIGAFFGLISGGVCFAASGDVMAFLYVGAIDFIIAFVYSFMSS